MCQLNWWLPIYPIEPDNSMGFYPRYFGEAVKNNSEIYNYYEWNTKHRATAAQHVKSDTREQPKPLQELEPVTVRFLPPPGGIVLFSGGQIHEACRTRRMSRATASIFGPCTTMMSSLAAVHQTLIYAAREQRCATICGQAI